MKWIKRIVGEKNIKKLVSAGYNESAVFTNYSDGTINNLEWVNLDKVKVVTNDSGPCGDDVWFVLLSKTKQIEFPLGLDGCDSTLKRLKELPGFQLQGMNSTSNAEFQCWNSSNAH
ncbi:MAG: hypothetical protein K6L81_11100 [Agarilytica sp.]